MSDHRAPPVRASPSPAIGADPHPTQMEKRAIPSIDLPQDWSPRPYQLPLWSYLEDGGRRAVAVWHRRAGKDDVCLHWAAVCAVQRRVGSYWHMLPQAAQARKAIWDAVNPRTGRRRIDEAFPRSIRKATRETDMLLRLRNGSTWQVVGSDNYDSLVGAPPVGVVFSEWALADPQAWAYLRPILAENGGWALFLYTPRGRNHGATFYEAAAADPDWFAQKLTAEQTEVFAPADLARERREYARDYGAEDGDARFRQEYLCDFAAAVQGAYYGLPMNAAEAEGRIGRVPHDPALPVETWWDLGIGDATAIWFAQRAGAEVRLIDYYESSGVGLAHYARVLQERGYVYGRHVAPHDIAVRELGTGKSRQEVAAALGIRFETAPRLDVADGIEAVRNLLPRCWLDAEKCARGIAALREYRREWDDKLKAFKMRPLHDWTSHAADALRYGAVAAAPVNARFNRRIVYPRAGVA